MKVSDFMKYVDVDKVDLKRYPDLGSFEVSLETNTYFDYSSRFNQRMSVQPIYTFMCTDTEVGVQAYFFDGEFCALSFQSSRKSDKEIYWKDKEIAVKVREYILSLQDYDATDLWLIGSQEIDWVTDKNDYSAK